MPSFQPSASYGWLQLCHDWCFIHQRVRYSRIKVGLNVILQSIWPCSGTLTSRHRNSWIWICHCGCHNAALAMQPASNWFQSELGSDSVGLHYLSHLPHGFCRYWLCVNPVAVVWLSVSDSSQWPCRLHSDCISNILAASTMLLTRNDVFLCTSRLGSWR